MAIRRDHIVRSRLAGDPPAILLTPRIASEAIHDFYKAEQVIADAEASVCRLRPAIDEVIPIVPR